MAARGRPRAFDRDGALRRAMKVFWEHGYDGASITDLTTAMGISSPSLYAAFGCKEQLFREAVALYNETEGAAAASGTARAKPTARDAIAEVLRHNVIAYTDPDKPRGCMIVLAATTDTERSRAVHEHLADWRMATEHDFRERIERGIADGDVPAGADAATIAAFYNAVNQGMAIQARDGADRAKLSAVAESAIAAWDGLVGRRRPSQACAARRSRASAGVVVHRRAAADPRSDAGPAPRRSPAAMRRAMASIGRELFADSARTMRARPVSPRRRPRRAGRNCPCAASISAASRSPPAPEPGCPPTAARRGRAASTAGNALRGRRVRRCRAGRERRRSTAAPRRATRERRPACRSAVRRRCATPPRTATPPPPKRSRPVRS